MRSMPPLRAIAVLLLLGFPLCGLALCGLEAQQPPAASAAQPPTAALPEPPQTAHQLLPHRPPTSAEAAEARRRNSLPLVNGVPYDQPSVHDLAADYVRDTYFLPGFARTSIRALYSEARDRPTEWGQDLPGFGQRFGSAEAVTVINGNVRLGMELVFHEDLRYLPCHGCSVKRKIANALLAEVTARHGPEGRRIFTLTPAISDFSGPIIAHSVWYPDGFDPFAGVVATRVVAASRVGTHLFQEYWIERHHRRDRERRCP